jgi:hypothetical protein
MKWREFTDDELLKSRASRMLYEASRNAASAKKAKDYELQMAVFGTVGSLPVLAYGVERGLRVDRVTGARLHEDVKHAAWQQGRTDSLDDYEYLQAYRAAEHRRSDREWAPDAEELRVQAEIWASANANAGGIQDEDSDMAGADDEDLTEDPYNNGTPNMVNMTAQKQAHLIVKRALKRQRVQQY